MKNLKNIALAGVAAIAFNAVFIVPASADGAASIGSSGFGGAFSGNSTPQWGVGSGWSQTGAGAGGWNTAGGSHSYGTAGAQGSSSGSAGASAEHVIDGWANGQISGFLGSATSFGSGLVFQTQAAAGTDNGDVDEPGFGAGSASGQTGGNGHVGLSYDGLLISFDTWTGGDTSSSVGATSTNNGMSTSATAGKGWTVSDVSLDGASVAAGTEASASAATKGNASAFGNTWNEAGIISSVSGILNGTWNANGGSSVSADASSSNGGNASGSSSASSFANNNGGL